MPRKKKQLPVDIEDESEVLKDSTSSDIKSLDKVKKATKRKTKKTSKSSESSLESKPKSKKRVSKKKKKMLR